MLVFNNDDGEADGGGVGETDVNGMSAPTFLHLTEEFDHGFAGGFVADTNTFERHALTHSGADGFAEGLLGRKTCGIVEEARLPKPIAILDLRVCKDPLQETITVLFKRMFDARDVDDIGTDVNQLVG